MHSIYQSILIFCQTATKYQFDKTRTWRSKVDIEITPQGAVKGQEAKDEEDMPTKLAELAKLQVVDDGLGIQDSTSIRVRAIL